MTYSTIVVIYNPNSTGPSKKMAQDFEKKVKQRLPKQRIELIATEFAKHGESLCYDIAKKKSNPLVISSSGDGGYNDIINGAMKAKRDGYTVTTGLLPAGNANDHHRGLNTEDIVDQIVEGKARNIDVLKLTGVSEGKRIVRYAHSYIGFGLSPFVGHELNQRKLNPFNEVFIVIKALFTIRPVRLKIGLKTRAYESVILSNIDVMSKYMRVSRPSSVTDGKFEVTMFRRRNKLKLILILLEASIKGVKEDSQVRRFSLRPMEKTLVQTDGEVLPLDAGKRVVITARSRALRCVI